MPDPELIDRLTDLPASGGDRLKDILELKAGGEAARLRNKLTKLWDSNESRGRDESVARMKARNTALRLAKNAKPRFADGGARAKGRKRVKPVQAYLVVTAERKKLRLSLCLPHCNRLKREHPTLKISEAAGRVKEKCEACARARSQSVKGDR